MIALPSEALRAHLSALDAFEDVSIIRGPTAQPSPPCIVIRASTPWVEPGTYCHDTQNYVAVCVTLATTPQDGEQQLYTWGLRIMDNLPAGWTFDGMDSPVVDESTGIAYLAAPVRLTYSNNDLEEES